MKYSYYFLFITGINAFDPKKFVHCNRVFVLYEFVVSGIQCNATVVVDIDNSVVMLFGVITLLFGKTLRRLRYVVVGDVEGIMLSLGRDVKMYFMLHL